MNTKKIHKIGFGGGCHWCTEAVFNHIIGVSKVDQGWIASLNENESGAYSEAVVVHYDSSVISLETLIAIHLHTHSSTSNHPMRKKYRSAVYYFEKSDVPVIEAAIDANRVSFAEAIITKAMPFVSFKENEERYQNYFQKNSEGQFCKNYIDPKVELLRSDFSEFFSNETVS